MNRLHDDVESTADRLSGRAGYAFDDTLDATQRAARRSLERLSDGADEMRDQFAPRLQRWAGQASELARRSGEAMRHGSERLRDGALHASDRTVGYVRHEPVKSMLIAIAAGAALVALAGLLGRGSSTRRWR